jgi:tetratricopeptide (TPR) repeat protein
LEQAPTSNTISALEGSSRHKSLTGWICGGLAVAVITCFWPVTTAQFINYDDNDYVTNNPMVLGGCRWEAIRLAFSSQHASNWHPVTWLSHIVDAQIFGRNPIGPHCVNLAFHVANTLLLFLLLKRSTGMQWRSAVVAALFGLHPLHVESVAWVAERKDVLSTFFGFLTLWAYVNYVEGADRLVWIGSEKSQDSSSGSHVGTGTIRKSGYGVALYGIALLLFALGLMSKPMLVTLPFAMLFLDYWPLNRAPRDLNRSRDRWRLVREKWAFFLLSAASCVITWIAQRGAMPSTAFLSSGQRLENAAVSYLRYLGKLFWPADLTLPYLHPGYWPTSEVAFSVLILVGVSSAAVILRRTLPFLITGWFWFLGTLVPVIGLVQVGLQSIADRYMYIPCIGILIIVVWGGLALLSHCGLTRFAPVPAVAALLACGLLTYPQAVFWHDSEALFKHSASVSQGNYVALANVGGALFERGQLDEAMKYYREAVAVNPAYPDALNSIGAILAAQGNPEAMQWFQRTLDLQPNHPEALLNMGNALAKQGKYEQATRYFEESLRVRPDDPRAYNNLGNALLKQGRIDDAILHYRTALRGLTDDPKIYENLAGALGVKGKLDEAIVNYRRALTLHTTNVLHVHYQLGLALAVRARWDEAIGEYQETLRLSPEHPEAEYNLGYAYRVQGRLKEAQTHLERALRLRPEFPLAHFNLGCVLADLGRKEEAVAHLRAALEQQPDYDEAKERLGEINKKR